VRDQGDLGICYAETAAQMTDAWRFTHGDTNYARQTSAFIVALDTDQRFSTQAELDRGNHVLAALNSLYWNGSCDERDVIEGLGTKISKPLMDDLKQFRYSKWYYLYYQRDPKAWETYYQSKISPWMNALESTGCTTEGQKLLSTLPPQKELAQILWNYDPRKQLRAILGAHCNAGRRLRPPEGFDSPSSKSWDMLFPDASEAQNKISSWLDSKNPQPIAIEYCGYLLTNGSNFRGVDSHGNRTKDCGEHASLVIGRRKNLQNGQCQFLIRNSWGKYCGGYSKDWSCENGNVWVDANALSANVTSILQQY
jgi:hypothetical protein